MADEKRDYFLMLEGCPGESDDQKHPAEIVLSEFGIVVANRGTRAHYGVGRPNFEPVTCSTTIEQSYPTLHKLLLTHAKIPKGVLTCRKAGKTQQDFLKISFTDVLITSVSTQSGPVLPVISFSFSFVKVEFQYREQREDGTLGGSLMAQFDWRRPTT